MSENKNVVEMHGCIVCARVFNVLAIYTPTGRLVDCKVTSSGGHCLSDENQPLVACDRHTTDEIVAAHKKWQSTKGKDADEEDGQ
jgi:hypothetical protein